MDDLPLQELLGLFTDSSTPWYVKAGVGAFLGLGGLYLRARKQAADLRKQNASVDATLVDVQSSAYAALKQQIDQQAAVIADLQGEINSLRNTLRQQQAAETQARKELAVVQIELAYARNAITEWHVIWEHIVSDAKRQGFQLPPINPPEWPATIGASK